MSHRNDCPDRWEAERAGREDARYRSYPERDHFECDEAQRDYVRGFRREHDRREEEREQEEREQEAESERRLQARREEQEREEEAYFASQESWEPQHYDEPTERDLCASNGHAKYPDGEDRFGARCFCGQVHYAEEASA